MCVGTSEFCLFAGTSVGLFVMSECAGTSVVCGVFVRWYVWVLFVMFVCWYVCGFVCDVCALVRVLFVMFVCAGTSGFCL